MTGKRQKKQSYNPPKESAAGQHEVAAKSEPHSAPSTPTRPSLDAASTRGGKGTKSTPSLGEVGASKNAKVAIPRQPPVNPPRYHRRVPRACESCRQRKSKCSGDTPVCRQCGELGMACQYPVGWRDKMNKWASSQILNALGS